MISDRDVWEAAVFLVKRCGDDAMLEAAERADKLLNAMERLQAKEPARRTV